MRSERNSSGIGNGSSLGFVGAMLVSECECVFNVPLEGTSHSIALHSPSVCFKTVPERELNRDHYSYI